MKRKGISDKVGRDDRIAVTMQNLRRIFRAIHDYSHEVNSQFGVTGPQLWALKTISETDNLPMGELSKRMYLHPSTVSGVVDRLENKGYVVRDRSRKDRRVVRLNLTPEGEELAKRGPSPVQGKMIYGLRGLEEKDLASIYQSVQKLVQIMEVQDLEVRFFFDKEEKNGCRDALTETDN